MISTDGVPLFKSSLAVFLVLLNLPPAIRMNAQNIVLAGLWYGSKKPPMDILLRQQPPHELSRPPRSIEKHLKYFKASELRTWVLFYSLPLLLGNLPPLYFHHYALLVCAIHMFLQGEITSSQIDAAEKMLLDFCKLLPELYGEDSCTANAHLLLHLTKYVRL